MDHIYIPSRGPIRLISTIVIMVFDHYPQLIYWNSISISSTDSVKQIEHVKYGPLLIIMIAT
jgi:hypothetical protein